MRKLQYASPSTTLLNPSTLLSVSYKIITSADQMQAAGVCILSVANVVAYAPLWGVVMFAKKIDLFHRKVVSDIPGNPHCFDLMMISLFRTLPEPSNFNLVWTSVPLSEPLLLRGTLPPARVNSLSIYGQGSADPPSTIDLSKVPLDKNGHFSVTIGKGLSDNESAGTISAAKWARGMISMRNYLVPPGTKVTTPEIVRARDGSVVRAAEHLYAGAPNLSLNTSIEIAAASRVLALNVFALVLLGMVFGLVEALLVLCKATLGGIAIYQFLFYLGKRGLKKHTSGICKEKNKLFLPTIEEGSQTSQPSRLHLYRIMQYDIQKESELSIQATINPLYQKYWSVVVYDEYGVPLPQHVYDENVRKLYEEEEEEEDEREEDGNNNSCGGKKMKKKKRKSPAGQNDDRGTYRFDIRLSNVTRLPTAHEPRNVDIIDVSSAPQGYVLFRLVHPLHQKAETLSVPSTVLLDKSGNVIGKECKSN